MYCVIHNFIANSGLCADLLHFQRGFQHLSVASCWRDIVVPIDLILLSFSPWPPLMRCRRPLLCCFPPHHWSQMTFRLAYQSQGKSQSSPPQLELMTWIGKTLQQRSSSSSSSSEMIEWSLHCCRPLSRSFSNTHNIAHLATLRKHVFIE